MAVPDPVVALHQAIRAQFEFGGDQVVLTPDTSFWHDLGFDSLDQIEIVLDLEEALGLTIDETEFGLIDTVGEAEAALHRLVRSQYQS